MRILLTNDDGIAAPGLALLEEIAGTLSEDVWVVAPADEQSGAGHSLTLTRPLRLRQLGERRFAVSGTPTDAVMMALGHLLKDAPPALILSGINRGANLAEDATYSGTVSAAMEGALAGVPSVALSQAFAAQGPGDNVSFGAAAAWAAAALKPLLAHPPEPGTLVNINFPAVEARAVQGIRVCRQGRRDYGRTQVIERRDPRGFGYYWFALGPTQESSAHDTDLEAIADSFVSVTPLHLDMTHEASLDSIGRHYETSRAQTVRVARD